MCKEFKIREYEKTIDVSLKGEGPRGAPRSRLEDAARYNADQFLSHQKLKTNGR